MSNGEEQERSEREERSFLLENYMLGSLYYRATHEDNPPTELIIRAKRWYEAIIGCTALDGTTRQFFFQKQQLLFCLVFDIGHIMIDAPRNSFRYNNFRHGGDPVVFMNYGRVLNQLLYDTSFQIAADIFYNDPSRDDLISWILGNILEPILMGPPTYDFSINPMDLREFIPQIRTSYEEYAALFDEHHEIPLKEALERAMHLFNRRQGPVLSAEKLDIIQNWDAFQRASQRTSAESIMRWSKVYPKFDPRRMRAIHEEQVETKLRKDSPYVPMGGIAGITHVGRADRPSTVVPSEFMYLDEEIPGLGIDLYTVRAAEKQLLFYEREGGQMEKVRRTIHIAIDPKSLSTPIAPGILAKHRTYGLIVRLVQDIALALPTKALRIKIHILGDKSESVSDKHILGVILRWEVDHEVVEIVNDPHTFDLRLQGDPHRRVYGLAIQGSDQHDIAGLPEPEPVLPQGVRPPGILQWKVWGSDPDDEEIVYTSLDDLENEWLRVYHYFLNWILRTLP